VSGLTLSRLTRLLLCCNKHGMRHCTLVCWPGGEREQNTCSTCCQVLAFGRCSQQRVRGISRPYSDHQVACIIFVLLHYHVSRSTKRCCSAAAAPVVTYATWSTAVLFAPVPSRCPLACTWGFARVCPSLRVFGWPACLPVVSGTPWLLLADCINTVEDESMSYGV
jgi:hypothetical protein